MSKILIQCLFLVVWFVKLDGQNNLDRPKIITQNGDIIIEPAFNKKIILRPNGPDSSVLAGDANLLQKKNSENGEQYQPSTDNNFDRYLSGPNSILSRLEKLENQTAQATRSDFTRPSTFLTRRVNRLMNRVQVLERIINEDKCASNPCQKGGTCLNLANGYHCLCPSNWEGKNCDIDVNECRNFAGTDLGCQNGATCINRPGTYECSCSNGWYGLHCTRREKDCSQGNYEMCGHGTCIPSTSGKGFTCLCDQGWETNGTGVECLTDVNECDARHGGPRCSVNPRVECVNWPGSFRCGQCPAGYEGDGFTCSDINECLTSNGGCSPLVTCHNTVGSRICGPCPQGYQGDGLTCTWKGSCNINHGGCHPSAQCVESMSTVQCVCPIGMDGDGIGIHGCYVSTFGNHTLRCEDNPCGIHGQCHQLLSGYSCLCYNGYSGAHCDVTSDPCSRNPCQNGGTCMVDSSNSLSGFRCECTAQYTGNLCNMKVKTCGGYLDSEEGSIVYPLTNRSYSDNTKCAWVIHTIPSKVINVTFSKFNLEAEPECLYDFLQIHDGRTSSSQLIGRFCGNEFPKGGKIISSHNYLYFWFRSDATRAGSGFALHWNSIDPVCGGEVNATTHGLISSPGSPGKYPPNRDCYWYLSTLPSKLISLSFFTLDIESHANCSFDFLAIYNGRRETDPLINKFCNSSQPQPISSTSSDIMIHFHSDSHGSGHGFQIAYAPVEGIPGCGGLYTIDKGEIVSPSFNGNYLNNLRCEYKISTGADSRIRIEFKSFDLEVSPRCRYDYVKVYDGPSTESKLIGKFCGHTMYPKFPITSSSNNLVIIFRTDRTMSYGGFKISFETVCQKTLVGDSGVITSPGYPFTYPPNKVCEYFISTVPGKAIQLTFRDFNIEDSRYYNCRYDFVEVRDGPDVNSTLLGKFCGIARYPPTQISTHNFLYVRFSSDLSNPAYTSYKGFYANYTTIDTECGGIYRETTGIINFPSSGETYNRNQVCSWVLVAPQGMHIKLSWNSFDLESSSNCFSDYLELIEVDNNNVNETIGKYCGTTAPPSLTTYTNRLIMKFKSDYNQQSAGFSVVYTYLDASRSCGGTYVKTHGFIYSPGWPKNYESNRICTWTIQVPVGQQIVLNISHFNLEQPYHNKCEMGDYLEIRNGLTQASALIGKYCGTMSTKRVTSMTNALYIHFHSDFYITGAGFMIEWTSTATRCGGTLTTSSGSITSPNYPEKYNDNEECFYKIVTNQGSRLRISFAVLDLENTASCRDDYVQIFDGKDENSRSLGKHCVMSTQLTNIQTTTNFAFIKFRSDFYISSKGFSLTYDTICKNNITGLYGVIESPDFPNNYPLNADCLWNINVPIGSKINVSFSHFDIHSAQSPPWGWRRANNNCADYLQIRESSQLEYSKKYCGSNKPKLHTTSSNSLQIKFVTGNYFPKTGFRLEWVSVGCGGRIQKRFGSLNLDKSATSSGQMECQWVIVAPLGKKISIQFEKVYMSQSINCTVDAIEILNGQTADSPLISKFCNDFQGTHKFQSTSNFMLVRLIKHSNLKDVHFTSSFSTYDRGCGGAIQSRTGMIYSPNYPKNYDNDVDCVWTIIVPQNHRIALNFLDFDLYDNDDGRSACSDLIRVYDSTRMENKNYTQVICPNWHVSPIISKSNVMALQFISDNIGTAKGFKANFTVTCGATIIATSDGVITNDKYLSLTNISCKWTIKAPRLDQKITLTITHLDIPKRLTNSTNKSCPSSFLRILDGDDENAPLVNEYCGRYTATIVSHGSALTLELGTYTDRIEGEFSAHYTSLDNACGGTLTSENGEVASPNYPGPYPPNSDCEWTLGTSPGNQVYITFEAFDLESSEDCNQDYLEVRENDGGGRLLGLYCGSTISTNTTTASKLYIKFRSDGTGSSKGFLLRYGFLHGNDITGLHNGEVASPLYPHPYGDPGQYTWRITVGSEETISLTITNLEIHTNGQSCTNNLGIYDGYDEEAPVLENVCGVLKDDEKTIKSSSNLVFIKLILDEFNTGSLFHIRWTSSNVATDSVKEKTVNCGSNSTVLVLPGNSSYFNTPNYPTNYNEDSNCEWFFKSFTGRHLELDFPTFHIEERSNCYADYVSVYSSDTPTNWKPVKTGICVKSETVGLNSSTYMKVNFVSDSSISEKGFQGRVTSKCGGILTESSGEVGPSWFDWNDGYGFLQCDWKIKVRPGRQISLQFRSFNITNDQNCKTFVILRNGESFESPLLSSGKYCGFEHEVKSDLVTSGNTLFITYTANRQTKRTFKTFSIWYEEKNIECGTTSTLNTEHNWEIISSPNYPSVPTPYTECVWVFSGPPGEILRIDFIDRFDIDSRNSDCSTEYVEVRDGSSELSPFLGRFCSEKPGTVKTRNNLLYVKYSTQISEPRNGFKANVSIDVCGGTIFAAEGELTSPGYPHMAPLPYGTVCVWQIIQFNVGHTFLFKAQDINLPDSESPCATKITIEESIPENNTVTLLRTYCGDHMLDSAKLFTESLTNNVTIKLHIGKSASFSQISQLRGFRFTFNSSMPLCTETITASQGYLTTPSYPRETTIRYCHWKIIAPDVNRRITLELEDFDAQGQRIGIYSVYDRSHVSTIQNIPSEDYSPSKKVFESTGNSLTLYVWLDATAGSTHRFKAKFNSDSPAMCGGPISGASGNLVSPTLGRAYTCKWRYNSGNINSTNTIVLKLQLNSSANTFRCRRVDPHLNIFYQVDDDNRITNSISQCANTDTVYRIPSNSFELTATKNKRDSLYFNVDWYMQPCGGHIIVTESPFNILNLASYNETLDCAWVITSPYRTRVEITLEGSFQYECDDEFIKVYPNSAQSSVVIGDYCKDKTQDGPLLAGFSKIFVDFHAKPRNNTSLKLIARLAQNQCGRLMTNEEVFSSPNYPKHYSENQECAWEIKTDLGSRVSLQFIGRFAVEGQPGACTKDVIILYDWKDNEYIEAVRLCGREQPQPYNSTFNRMKVVFRTNDNINLDGFQAQWTRICGGNYIATEKERFLYSPGYPFSYRPHTQCVYILNTTSERSVFIKFTDFDLRGPYPECESDNLTITADTNYDYFYGVYCGTEFPPLLHYKTVTLKLNTDSFIYKRGFKLSYWVTACGGEIKSPKVLSSSTVDEYDSNLNCTWNIEAPSDKVVVLNFINFELEHSYSCYNDYLAVYDGLSTNEDKRLALLCGGQDNSSSLVIKSTNNTMLMNFVTDSSLHGKGFKVAITFSYSESVGCGGHINLTSSTTLKSPFFSSQGGYESFLDCIWTVVAPIDHVIRLKFLSFHIAPCQDVNQTAIGISKCDCDYVLVRDGIQARSTDINRYCGHTLPMEIVSSGNTLSVILHTDGEVNSSGFEATLSVEESACGQSHYSYSKKATIIKSPGYQSGSIPRGLHCIYHLQDNDVASYAMTHLFIKNLDLQTDPNDANKCSTDKLIISRFENSENTTLGSEYIMSADTSLFFDTAYLFEQTETLAVPSSIVLCGVKKSLDFYMTGSIKLRLQTSPPSDTSQVNHKGFEIEVSHTNYCSKNYTEPYGRVRNNDHAYYNGIDKRDDYDCYILITVPENYTVSAYFISTTPTYWHDDCYLEIHDGNTTSAKKLKRIGVEYSSSIPTVFSTGRYMLLHNHGAEYGFINYDMVYVSSGRIPGCGGKLVNEIGRITSPLYPDIFRQKATCEWELETPPQTRLHLRFSTFDLSSVCEQVYVKLVDRKGDDISQYCEEAPADYTSPDNYVKIVFVSTMNNGGQGWVAEFIGIR